MFKTDTATQGSRLLLQPISLEDTLEKVAHRHLNLSVDGKRGCTRPNMRIYPGADEDMPPAVVTLAIDALMGEQRRWIDMTPAEARTLAAHLVLTAQLIEREMETVS